VQAERITKNNPDFFCYPEAQPIFDSGHQSAVNVVQAERITKNNPDFFCYPKAQPIFDSGDRPLSM
jgi:hypothetical protein